MVIILLFLLTLPSTMASVDQKIKSIVKYAERYEMGKISYLQMQVFANFVREQINDELGENFIIEEDYVEKGLSRASVERIFGKPTEMTRWAWVMNEEHEMKLDEPLPRWEKTVFDGRKLQITFNAWPHIITGDIYYVLNFNLS